MTLELWADPGQRRRALCCSAAAVRASRARSPTAWASRTSRWTSARSSAPGSSSPGSPGTPPGVTPNPCVRCNGSVRLDAMVAFADRLGAASLATGHYARLRDGRLQLAEDRAKDQTYMLAATPPATLARLRFPLGDLEKAEVRALAARGGPAGRRQARLPGPLLPRRHDAGRVPRPPRRAGGPPGRPRRRARARRRPSPRPAPLHRRPAARPGRRDGRAALRARQGRGAQHGDRRLARGLWRRPRSACAICGCTASRRP